MPLSHRCSSLATLAVLCLPAISIAADDAREALWAAVRNSDIKTIRDLLDKGTEVNARNEIGVTALWVATAKGKLDVVEMLVERGADVNARDGIWYQTPLSNSIGEGQTGIVKLLIRSGARDVDNAIITAAAAGKLAVVEAVLEHGKIKQEALDAALFATPPENKDVQEALRKAGAKPIPAVPAKERESLAPLAGIFESENGGKLTIEVNENGLQARRSYGAIQLLRPADASSFKPLGIDATSYTFERKGEQVYRVVLKYFTAEASFYRLESKPVAKPAGPPGDEGEARIDTPLNWPSFRGTDGSGVADGQHPPLSWDVEKSVHLRWKTPIPGLGHSCPVVWGDRVIVSTAISGDPNPKVRTGNYGDVASVDDSTKHSWQLFCLDRDSGKVLWSRTAFEGVPKIKRHLKGSQANCTPATDGQRIVVCFGSEGLYCYDFAGKLLWQRDLSTLDSSWKMDDEYQWGFGSSPILHEGLVILQCDLSKDSFVAAYRLEDGSRVWSTPRDEVPSWSSPIIWRSSRGVQLVTNASQFARGYDPATGKELWRLAKKSEATIPTPVASRDLLYISSGNRPIQPIFAIRASAMGDISLKADEDRNDHIAWSRMRGGPYMPSPILYGKYLYTCSNAGILTCYEAETGKEIYKERLGGVSYTASPLAADGKLYFTSEQGEVRIVKAGRQFELLAINEIGDVCLATPAISAGTLYVRSQHYLFALGRKKNEK
jgi:outer membrane protein assembly factor BamB